MLVRSTALDWVLREFGSEEKILRFVNRRGIDVRQALLDVAVPVAYLRLHSLRAALDLRFDGLQFSQFVDRQTLVIDSLALVQTVKNHSQRHDLRSADLLQSIGDLQDAEHNVWQLCNGHDLVGVLSFALRSTIGTQRAQTVAIEELNRALRLAYAETDFVITEQYRMIREWEQRTNFQVLRSL